MRIHWYGLFVLLPFFAFLGAALALFAGKLPILIPQYRNKAKKPESKIFERIACGNAALHYLSISIFFAFLAVCAVLGIEILLWAASALLVIYAIVGHIAIICGRKTETALAIIEEIEKSDGSEADAATVRELVEEYRDKLRIGPRRRASLKKIDTEARGKYNEEVDGAVSKRS